MVRTERPALEAADGPRECTQPGVLFPAARKLFPLSSDWDGFSCWTPICRTADCAERFPELSLPQGVFRVMLLCPLPCASYSHGCLREKDAPSQDHFLMLPNLLWEIRNLKLERCVFSVDVKETDLDFSFHQRLSFVSSICPGG